MCFAFVVHKMNMPNKCNDRLNKGILKNRSVVQKLNLKRKICPSFNSWKVQIKQSLNETKNEQLRKI